MKIFGPKKTTPSRGPSYFDRENLVHTLQDLKNIYFPKGKIEYNTDETIIFNNMQLKEITMKKLNRIIGVPDYIIPKLEYIDDYRIVFYRHSIGKFNYLMQFHFCKNDFLFVNNMIRSTYVLTYEDKKNILVRLKDKYFADVEFDYSKGFDLQITDQDNNFFYTMDDVNFSITYINNSNKFVEIIDKIKSKGVLNDNNPYLL